MLQHLLHGHSEAMSDMISAPMWAYVDPKALISKDIYKKDTQFIEAAMQFLYG